MAAKRKRARKAARKAPAKSARKSTAKSARKSAPRSASASTIARLDRGWDTLVETALGDSAELEWPDPKGGPSIRSQIRLDLKGVKRAAKKAPKKKAATKKKTARKATRKKSAKKATRK
jgi:hypothetical protein